MTRGRTLGGCLTTAMLMFGATEAGAQSSQGHLASYTATLRLGQKREAERWLLALGVEAGRPAVEQLLVANAQGQVVAVRSGTKSAVTLGAALDSRLYIPGNPVVLIHNHPLGNGLSLDDLEHLAKPGVAAIVAIGHDLSVYAAGAGPRFDERSIDRLFALALTEVERDVRISEAAGKIDPLTADSHIFHLVAEALATAGVLEYQAHLGDDRGVSYARWRMVWGRAARWAADAVIQDLRKSERR
jgi:hypothetical protein